MISPDKCIYIAVRVRVRLDFIIENAELAELSFNELTKCYNCSSYTYEAHHTDRDVKQMICSPSDTRQSEWV